MGVRTGISRLDSLKEISKFFSVSIDEMLSGEKIISIAEKENKSNIRNMCDLLLGICDMLYCALIILLLYSNPAGGHIYAVNLNTYLERISFCHAVYWTMFLVLPAIGIAKILLSHFKPASAKSQKALTLFSMLIGIFTVLFLALTREAYAIGVSFLLFLIKGVLVLKYVKADG